MKVDYTLKAVIEYEKKLLDRFYRYRVLGNPLTYSEWLQFIIEM